MHRRLTALDGLAKIIALAFRRCPDCGKRFLRGRVDRKLRVICRGCKDEALGWEIKVEHGKFGRPELDAHSAIAEKLGRHRALMEAHHLLAEILRANAELRDRSGSGTPPQNQTTKLP